MTTTNVSFLREYSNLGFSEETIKNKIQLSKKIHGIDFIEKNGFVFGKGELFQHEMFNFTLAATKTVSNSCMFNDIEEKIYEIAKNGDFLISLIKTPSNAPVAIYIVQNNEVKLFKIVSNRNNHNEIISIIQNDLKTKYQ